MNVRLRIAALAVASLAAVPLLSACGHGTRHHVVVHHYHHVVVHHYHH